MDMGTAVRTCLTKYATFTGRARRSEYWWFFLAELIVLAIFAMISDVLYGIAALGLLLPALAVSVRRLHDIGKSGWFLLLGLIPLVNLVLLYWAVQPSVADNEYGPSPMGLLPVEPAAPGAV